MGITKRQDGLYVEFRVTDDGTCLRLDQSGKLKRWKVGGFDKKTAMNAEALIKTRLLSGQEQSPARSMTFAQLADQYLTLEHVQRARSQSHLWAIKALRDYFGSRPISSITTQDVIAYRASRAPRSIATINLEHTQLSTMLNAARRVFGWRGMNVAADVPKPDPKNSRDLVITQDQLMALMQAAAPHLRPLLLVAHDTGARRGELLKLEWADVSLERKELTLRDTKNGDTRVVPLTERCVAVLAGLPRGSRVFTFGGKPLRTIHGAFTAACRRAGIGGLRFHDLRHTAATNLRRAGVHTQIAMKIVGHKSDVMHRRYAKVDAKDMHQAMAQLEKYSEQS